MKKYLQYILLLFTLALNGISSSAFEHHGLQAGHALEQYLYDTDNQDLDNTLASTELFKVSICGAQSLHQFKTLCIKAHLISSVIRAPPNFSC